MASLELTDAVVRGWCRLWNREYDEFVATVYHGVCKRYDDKLVERVASRLAETCEYMPKPVEFGRCLQAEFAKGTPRLTAPLNSEQAANIERVREIVDELARRLPGLDDVRKKARR